MLQATTMISILFAREVRKAIAVICSQKNNVKPKVETPKIANGIIRIILP
jgi:hypothetical protein